MAKNDLVTASQMRAMEKRAMDANEVSGLTLMERAGRGVVSAIQHKWPGGQAIFAQAVVLCGPGNNGGDGYVIARLLKEAGWNVQVFALGAPTSSSPDALANRQLWDALGSVSPLSEALDLPAGQTLLIDALFGTGLTRPVALPMDAWAANVRKAGGAVVAVDIPSGLCSDSGRVIGEQALQADLTVTFHKRKLGHFLAEGPATCGSLVCTGIGLRTDDWDEPLCRLVVRPDRNRILKSTGHKFSYGHALVLSGGAGKSGAARLSAMGALRIGAGLVTIGAAKSSLSEIAQAITSLMVTEIDDARDLGETLQDPRYSSLCLGPGLGFERARTLVPAALASKRPTVLDADALSAFADAPHDLLSGLHEDCILTPHGGEFARLFPDIASQLAEAAMSGPAYSKVDAARDAAKTAGCMVLLKGPDTVIAAPDGRVAICASVYQDAAPWLATAGSGDVLAGFICGLWARGGDLFQSACDAAWLHAECARTFGPGLIAEDIPAMIPRVLKELGPQ